MKSMYVKEGIASLTQEISIKIFLVLKVIVIAFMENTLLTK